MKVLLTASITLFFFIVAVEHSTDLFGAVATILAISFGSWSLLKAWRILNFNSK